MTDSVGSDVVTVARELCHRECVYAIILGDAFVFLGVNAASRKRYHCHKKVIVEALGERNKTVVTVTILNISFQPWLCIIYCMFRQRSAKIVRFRVHPYMYIGIHSSPNLLQKIQFYTPGLLCIISREPSFHKDVPGFIYP